MDKLKSTKVLIAGCGDLGAVVALQLLQLGMEVTGLSRSGKPIPGIHTIQADVTQPATLRGLTALQPQILIYCVAADGQSDEQYRLAYVDGLRHVLETQVCNPSLKHVFFVSSTRVYGQETNEVLSEQMRPVPTDFGGKRLLEAEGLLQPLSCGATILRLSGIYGPGRLRMINLAKSVTHWPAQNAWSNRIHRDDAAMFIVFLIQQLLAGASLQQCYIVTDSAPVAQYEVLSWIADQLKINKPEQKEANGGKRLSNHAMLATGYKLHYPDYRAGYRSLLANHENDLSV